jgi:hypothetical protein
MVRVLFFCLVWITSAYADGSPKSNINEIFLEGSDQSWFQCARDEDCIVIAGTCNSPLAANKKHVKEVREFLKNKAKQHDCSSFLPRQWPETASCQRAVCSLNWDQKTKAPAAQH